MAISFDNLGKYDDDDRVRPPYLKWDKDRSPEPVWYRKLPDGSRVDVGESAYGFIVAKRLERSIYAPQGGGCAAVFRKGQPWTPHVSNPRNPVCEGCRFKRDTKKNPEGPCKSQMRLVVLPIWNYGTDEAEYGDLHVAYLSPIVINALIDYKKGLQREIKDKHGVPLPAALIRFHTGVYESSFNPNLKAVGLAYERKVETREELDVVEAACEEAKGLMVMPSLPSERNVQAVEAAKPRDDEDPDAPWAEGPPPRQDSPPVDSYELEQARMARGAAPGRERSRRSVRAGSSDVHAEVARKAEPVVQDVDADDDSAPF